MKTLIKSGTILFLSFLLIFVYDAKSQFSKCVTISVYPGTEMCFPPDNGDPLVSAPPETPLTVAPESNVIIAPNILPIKISVENCIITLIIPTGGAIYINFKIGDPTINPSLNTGLLDLGKGKKFTFPSGGKIVVTNKEITKGSKKYKKEVMITGNNVKQGK